jgi:glutathione synthase
MNNLRLGVVMDPIQSITPAKDSTLAMLLEAKQRNHDIFYFEQADLRLENGEARGSARPLEVVDNSDLWHEFGPREDIALGQLDAILMRKDPPFDTEFIYTTYILERAELAGALIVNRPASLRDINEKVYTAWFPQCCPPTLVTRNMRELRAFADTHGKIIVKPLDGMGGRSIFAVETSDKNTNVIFETLTDFEARYTIAQKYIPEIKDGDKRILMVNGKPAPYALARIPPEGDNRGNLVSGAQPEIRELTERDRWICSEVGPVLEQKGVLFAGLDVIGDFLTEINVTSPTGIREIAKLANVNVAADLMDAIETGVRTSRAAAQSG